MITDFILGVDGVLTDGSVCYTADGSVMKVFGPHDEDGLKMLPDTINVRFVTTDVRGFSVSKRRINDMGYDVVAVEDQFEYVKKVGFGNTAYMGAGYHDAPILLACAFGFAPSTARSEAKLVADYVTFHGGGQGAVFDACLYLKRYYKVLGEHNG